MSILFLDVETTGTNPKEHSVIQIAAEFHNENGDILYKFNKKLQPYKGSIDLGALKYNNSSLSALESNTETFAVLKQFIDFLLLISKNQKSITVAGHNVHFDVAFIKEFLSQYGVSGLDSIISYKLLDTATISEFLKDSKILDIESTKLENLCKKLELKLEEDELEILDSLNQRYHDAAYDVRMTAKVYYKLKELIAG